MRVLVTGGRDYHNDSRVFGALNRQHAETPITLLIQGWCRTGADWRARRWCWEHKVACLSDPADWHKHDKAAGPIRNSKILKDWQPDLVIAFPGGSGTADMVTKAERAGLKVVRV